jgi:hypothetical protein
MLQLELHQFGKQDYIAKNWKKEEDTMLNVYAKFV